MMNMHCRMIKKLLSDYLDKALSGDKKQIVEEHLKQCSDCETFFKELQAIEALTKQKATEGPSPEYWLSYWPRLNEKIENIKAFGFNIAVVKERIVDWLACFEPLPSLKLATNIAILVILFSFVFLFHNQGKQLRTIQQANKQLARQMVMVAQEYARRGEFAAERTMPMAVLPVAAVDKDIRIFQGIEDLFPGRMEWVVLSNGTIEMGIRQEGRGSLESDALQGRGALFYLRFSVSKKAKSGKVDEVVSSPKMMILNEREISVKLDSLVDGRDTTFRYECLPRLTPENRIELFTKIDVDGSLLQTNLLLREGESEELGTINKGTDVYTISVTVQRRKYQIKTDEEHI